MRSRSSRLLIFVMEKMAAPLSEAAKWWYNVTAMKQNITGAYYTPIQLKMPLEIERMIEVNDPVYRCTARYPRGGRRYPKAV